MGTGVEIKGSPLCRAAQEAGTAPSPGEDLAFQGQFEVLPPSFLTHP